MYSCVHGWWYNFTDTSCLLSKVSHVLLCGSDCGVRVTVRVRVRVRVKVNPTVPTVWASVASIGLECEELIWLNRTHL